jgi:phospholipid/cholesterol/gamma-HCH transport system substrate-binding protein
MASVASQRLRPAGNLFETVLSALVILVALGFVGFMLRSTGTGHFGSYALTLRLPSATGLDVGKDVRVAGVKVGTVSRLSLGGGDYSARVEITVRDDLFLPADSTAGITVTPLGDVYLTINPGHAVRTIPPGGTLMAMPAKSPARAAGS